MTAKMKAKLVVCDDREPEWDEIRTDFLLMFDRKHLASMLRRALDAVEDASSLDYVEMRVPGLLTLCGHLPEKTTFLADEKPCPGVLVVDEVNGWPDDEGL